MDLTIKQSRSTGEEKRVIVTLAGGATIGEVERIKAALLAAMADCGELLLDVGDVTSADLSLLQLIHAARHSAAGAGIKLALVGESVAAFHETAIAAGFPPQSGQ